MHLFLHGEKNIGKSTAIRKVLEILSAYQPVALSGFFTWNGGKEDPHVYLKPAGPGDSGEVCRVASWNEETRILTCDTMAFDRDGVQTLENRQNAQLIIMDELGFLEKDAMLFRQAVMDTIAGDVPIIGVLRMGDVPWHDDIKRSPNVEIIDVDKKNRDTLPQELANRLKAVIWS